MVINLNKTLLSFSNLHNMFKTLIMSLSLPVREHSFLWVWGLKTYVCSTTRQERLHRLSKLLCIERTCNSDILKIVDKFYYKATLRGRGSY